MVDVVFVLVLIGLFAITAGFVVVCDRMLGADEDGGAGRPGAAEPDRVMA